MTATTLKAPETNFSLADSTIAELRDEYMGLVIIDVDDSEGFNAVHEARMVVRGKRIDVEKKRKELKADALEYGRRIDSEAKRITALLEPIESHLEAEESKVVQSREQIKAAEEAKRRAALQTRLDQLIACQCVMQPADVEALSEGDFLHLLATKQAESRERLRIAAEGAEKRRIEAEQLAKERAELDRVRQEQAAAQAKIDADNKRIAEAEAARQRAIELEDAKRQAAERATREAEERQQREAAAAKAKADADEADRVRAEALRPDRDKLLAVADAVSTLFVPEVSKTALAAAREVCQHLANAAEAIRKTVEKLK